MQLSDLPSCSLKARACRHEQASGSSAGPPTAAHVLCIVRRCSLADAIPTPSRTARQVQIQAFGYFRLGGFNHPRLNNCPGKLPDKLQEHVPKPSVLHASRHPSCRHVPGSAGCQEMTVQWLPQTGLADAAAESCTSEQSISHTIAANQAQPGISCAAVLVEVETPHGDWKTGAVPESPPARTEQALEH